VPTEFIKELSGLPWNAFLSQPFPLEAICDGFNPNRVQRAQILPQAWTKAGTVARNYFNNARSHRKKAASVGPDSLSTTPSAAQPTLSPPMDTSYLATQTFTTPTSMPLFEGRAFQPVFLPFHPQASYLHQLGDLNERATIANGQLELRTDLENIAAKSGFVPVDTTQEMKEP
jgi:hypothetical protein